MMSFSNMPPDIQNLNDREKQAIVCMYFARLERSHPDYKERNRYFAKLSERFNRKINTYKNDKDAFDACYPDNGRIGWVNVPLEKRSRVLFDVFSKYGNMDIDEHKKLVDDIMNSIEENQRTFYSIKTKTPHTVKSILKRESNIEVDGLNILKNDLHENQPVFIVLGGDKGKSEVTWDTGLIGIGIISRPPYDEGYKGNYYKIKIDVKVLLDKPIKREDLVPYKDTYDIIGIGPITKWEPNQAISQMEEKKAVALMRAMLEINPGIEEDLANVIDDNIMARVKGSIVKFVPKEFDYGEKPETADSTEDEYGPPRFINDYTDTYDPDISYILQDFSISHKTVVSMKNFINASKHIILTGPPGTGKTTLAERACEEAVRTNYISGYIMTTAIADWSTFDTVGGYMPDKEERLVFQEGVFLKSIRENKWLIIDEINRSEVDKAFGHFFTVLSGRSVDLQYKSDNGRHVSIRHSDSLGSYYDENEAVYYIGRNWRIIATMNTYDKNSLFMLSYAFMRRFAFVHIPAPNEDHFNELITARLAGQEPTAEILREIIRTSPKKMGPAIILDLIDYLETAGHDCIVDGICSLIIPQYEGISLPQIRQLYKNFGSLINASEREVLKNYLCEFFDISDTELIKTKFDDNEDQDE